MKNVVLLPHLGSATIEARVAMGMTVLDNAEAFFAGAPPPNGPTDRLHDLYGSLSALLGITSRHTTNEETGGRSWRAGPTPPAGGCRRWR